jgi:uncharacterized protein
MPTYLLPIYPLDLVICPGGLLPLKISEARFLDMANDCIKNNTSLGIVTTLAKGDCKHDLGFPLADIGTVVAITSDEVSTDGSMHLQCVGKHRIKIHALTQETKGLLIGEVTDIPNDLRMSIPNDLQLTSNVLSEVLKSVSLVQNSVIQPYQLDSASWVSNRWIEILKLPLIQKNRLMQLESPIVRLELIQDILEKGFQVTL